MIVASPRQMPVVDRKANFADTRPSTIVQVGESAVTDHAHLPHYWEAVAARSVGGMGLWPVGDCEAVPLVPEGVLDSLVERWLGSHLCVMDYLPWACHHASSHGLERHDVGLEVDCRQNVREVGR